MKSISRRSGIFIFILLWMNKTTSLVIHFTRSDCGTIFNKAFSFINHCFDLINLASKLSAVYQINILSTNWVHSIIICRITIDGEIFEEMDITLAVQQYIQQAIPRDAANMDLILTMPDAQDQGLWKYEHLRQFCME